MAKIPWKPLQLDAFRKEIVALIREIPEEERLEWLFDETNKEQGRKEPEAWLRCLVLVIATLAHHERHLGLTAKQIKLLYDLGLSLLKLARVPYRTSKLSILYGELHFVFSQILLKEGQFWGAFWEQKMATRKAGKYLPGGLGFHLLLTAMKASRLGQGRTALAKFKEALEEGLSDRHTEMAQIGLLNTLRIMRRDDDFQEALSLLEGQAEKHPEKKILLTELQWEKRCFQLAKTKDHRLFSRDIRPGRIFYSTTYVLEAYLWGLCLPTTKWTGRSTKIRTLLRKSELSIKRSDLLSSVVLSLEDLNDESIPIDLRLEDLRLVMGKLKHLQRLDKELLAWLAISRWLARHKFYDLSSFCLQEYIKISLTITGGRSQDSIGLGEDLIGKPWFHNETGHSVEDFSFLNDKDEAS